MMGTGLTSFERVSGAAAAKQSEGQNTASLKPLPWAELLNQAIESEILPRLLEVQRDFAEASFTGAGAYPRADIAAFLELVIADDMEQARAVADRVIVQWGGRDALLDGLLTPAARLLGDMWEQDSADFMTVTLAVYRLDQIMKETAMAGQMEALASGFDHRILLLPAPGEQHGFGLGMVADAFREGGWCVRSGPAVTRAQLLHLVRDEWFDVVGLSVTTERWLKGLPACIRAVRAASCNPHVFMLLGGHAVVHDSERSRFLGADATPADAREALTQANIFVETTVTAGLLQSKTRLVDVG